jgi:hypothetical protein
VHSSKKSAPRKAAAPEPPPPAPPPPVKVDFSRLEHIRSEARATMERLIVAESEEAPPAQTAPPPVQAPTIAPPPAGALELTPAQALRSALSADDIAIIAYLCTETGLPPPMDALALDRINEAALDHLGDTLIDTAGETPRLFEEYKDIWV